MGIGFCDVYLRYYKILFVWTSVRSRWGRSKLIKLQECRSHAIFQFQAKYLLWYSLKWAKMGLICKENELAPSCNRCLQWREILSLVPCKKTWDKARSSLHEFNQELLSASKGQSLVPRLTPSLLSPEHLMWFAPACRSKICLMFRYWLTKYKSLQPSSTFEEKCGFFL